MAILASCDPKFPIAEWDRLLDQAELTLNLLRNSRVNPKLSSHAYLFGNFDFNSTPIAPPGTKVQVQIKTGQRGSWSYHSEDGWYVGRAINHYRCVNCYIPATHRTRIADTVKFFPTIIPFPSVTLEDFLRQATSDILAILQHPPSLPTLQCGDMTQEAIIQIAQLLNRTVPLPVLQQSPTSTPITQLVPTPIHSPAAVPRVSATPLHSLATVPRVSPTPTPYLPRTETPIVSPTVPLKNIVPSSSIDYDELTNTIISVLQNNSNTSEKQPKRKHSRPYNLRRTPIRQPGRPYNLRSQRPHETSFRNLAQQHLVAQHVFSTPTNNAFHMYNPTSGKKETIDSLLNSTAAQRWTCSLSNEWGRLAQGNKHGVKATDTIDFIHRYDVPTGRKVTYGSFVCDYRPLKDDPYRVRLVVGGDKLDYPDDPASPAAGLLQTKLLINSTISDAKKGARFMSMDLKDHFLASPMERPEFMRVHRRHIPHDIFEQYNLKELVTPEGFVYIKIKKACTASSKLRYLHTKNSSKILHLTAIIHANTQLVYGVMTHCQPNFVFVLMILVLSISLQVMLITS